MIQKTPVHNRAFAVSMFCLIRRISKVVLCIIGLLVAIWAMGFDLKTALAGVGIGGIAIALGAQKTLENLIGGITVLTDRVMNVGDRCKVDGQIGTVEDISLRSTKFRTLDGSLLAVPNGIMATINLENLSDRKYFLFNPIINLRYKTSAEKLLQGLIAIRHILDEAPQVDREDLRVCLKGFGPSTLDVEVFANILTSNFTEYIEIRQKLLMQILRAMKSSGIEFAFPSQTLYLTQDSSALSENK
jgi:MscS family membrane protein